MKKMKILIYILYCVAILDIRNTYGMDFMLEKQSEFSLRKNLIYITSDDSRGLSSSAKSLIPSICLKNVLYEVKDRHALRKWLYENHGKETECWIFVKRGIPKDEATFWYLDAVEEALCFGWIDSIVKNVLGIGLVQKLSPRKKNSHWSELNKERCRRLEKLGLMTPAGRAVLPNMSEEGFVIDHDVLTVLQKDPQVWGNFQKFPSLYKHVRIDYIQRTKRNRMVYESRLKNFIKKTKKNIIFGEWNDQGRLINY